MNCVVCGRFIEQSRYINKTLCSSECFSIDFWNSKVENFSSKHTVIDGDLYFVGPENSQSEFRGFGGRIFKIKYNDGRVIETTNLWPVGKVPPSFVDKLPNNAEFIT